MTIFKAGFKSLTMEAELTIFIIYVKSVIFLSLLSILIIGEPNATNKIVD